MNTPVTQPLLKYLKEKKKLLLQDLEMLENLINELEPSAGLSEVVKEKIDWEKEIIKAIWENSGAATKGEIINALKGRISIDTQTLKNEVSTVLVLKANKTLRKYKVARSFKYAVAN